MGLSDNIFASNLNAICHVGSFYSIKKGVSWEMEPWIFGQNKFYYIKSGKCTITINDTVYEGIPGRWFLIPAGVLHSYSNDTSKTFSKFWMHFDLYPENINFISESNLPYYVDVPKNSKVDKLFKEYFDNEYTPNIAGIIKRKVTLLSLIGEYVNLAAPDITLKIDSDALITNTIKYIDDNMEQDTSVVDLAEFFHLHPNHFIRIFKKKTGETPGKFIQLKKMEAAKKLIEETDLPINEIMCRVGIVDAAQFTKKFHKFWGNSPREYRKHTRQMSVINKPKLK
ncbi:MAG: AraC family transcriptional regulator [Ruminococcaceae bacterium]|nr:AraC family transcriptional regulator [Oscillospiraceae bacterium]